MVEAWTADSTAAILFQLLDNDGYDWLSSKIWSASTYIEYEVSVGPAFHLYEKETVLMPLQWIRACLSLDSSKVKMVANGELLVDEEYKKDEDTDRPANLNLRLGLALDVYGAAVEYIGKFTNLNFFKSSLSVEKMKGMTTAGGEECGAPGDLVNWEEAEWTLNSTAKVIEVDREWEGPCRRESQVQIFTANFEWHDECMEHCQKIAGGRSPPVTTKEEWEKLTREIDLITEDRSVLPWMWISATEGDKNLKVAELDHWPEAELINNKTKKLEAVETVWRDYYTGQKLDDWRKPYYREDTRDAGFGDTYNCMMAFTDVPWNITWFEFQCITFDQSCPCSYPTQPMLRLRNLCSSSLIDNRFVPKQLPDNPGNMIILGDWSTRIEYNDTTSQWILTDGRTDVTAISRATKLSYLLGKHKWTISNDGFECNEGKPYTTMLKLTGCAEDEFTCNDGQCVKMERRCDQVTGKAPNCRDKSDENGCQLLVLENSYNKNIPPIGNAKDGSAIPADVSISIILMKVVEIEEVDHSIHLQFQISLTWKENRVKYQNLKKQTSLNALAADDVNTIWLPLIVYDNTDQKEVTRLGENWEWATDVTVTREGNFTRSGIEEVDEAEIFKGAENRLTMYQTYTWEFQCKYELQRYPFDTQVN